MQEVRVTIQALVVQSRLEHPPDRLGTIQVVVVQSILLSVFMLSIGCHQLDNSTWVTPPGTTNWLSPPEYQSLHHHQE
uniref:Uncharacterized protein n=1 Tax=Ditylenchus dipsaci TaxID=166011 RepID=A0A915DII9_9BILA